MLLETLERRELLAADGPELIGIRPDARALLLEGETLNVPPRELNLLFDGDANLDEATINSSSIKLVRSGGNEIFGDGDDVEVALGYVGLVDPGSTDPFDLNEVVIRPASSASFNVNDLSNQLPDDLYQIQIVGTGATPLSNLSGQALGGGEDVLRTFRLDRGAQVVAIDPQPITRSGAVLTQASDQIEVFFDDQDLDSSEVIDPAFYQLINTSGTLTSDDDSISLPESVTYDAAANKVVLTFASPIPEGNYRLDIGQAGSAAATPIQIGTLFTGVDFRQNAFLGDANGTSNDGADVDTYQTNLTAGSTINLAVTPHNGSLDLRARLLNSGGTELANANVGAGAVTSFSEVIAADGIYTIEVTSADGSTGSYQIQAVVTGNDISTDDDNSAIGDATDLSSLGNKTVTISSQIQRQTIPLPPLPGSEDEPGHRQIQREQHIGAVGTTPSVPRPITQRGYFFPDTLGADSFGNPFLNLISETEKQIVREIYEIYANISGFEFVETQNAGTMVGKGDLRALNPAIGPNDGVAGLGGAGAVVLNGSIYNQNNRFFGDGFTGVMFHEIGHSLGLGHSYDIPSNMGSGVPNDILPGDHDVVHLQRITPPNSTDVDLYRFDLTETGRFQAETVAERLATPSFLNTVLTLYQQTPEGTVELVARNDQYFGADSFIDLKLDAGTYFIGVTSTGNTNFDPMVPNSGFGGTTDGAYDLKLSFQADEARTLSDVRGTSFDGDADGVPGGVHSFWFQSSDPASTIFVDKIADTNPNADQGSGTLADPFDTIDGALAVAGSRIVVPIDGATSIADGEQFVIDDGINTVTFRFGTTGSDPVDINSASNANDVAIAIRAAINAAVAGGRLSASVITTASGQVVQIANIDQLDISLSPTLVNTPNVVRILGNGGSDDDPTTLGDNRPYLVGLDQNGFPLADGAELLVPQGVNLVVQSGALLKLRKANIDAGTSSANVSRSSGSIQVIGTPEASVYLRSFHDDTAGGNSDGIGPAQSSGDFGGVVFREDSDMESQGIFLNYINHADISHGGGKVFVNATESVFNSVHITDARPTVSFNQIALGDDAAVSASPNSFDDSLGRIGPDVHGNFLSGNTIDGLFIRVDTALGSTIEKLEVNGRFNDTDIAHVLTENLIINGAAGGPIQTPSGLQARPGGRLRIDGGTVLKLSSARIEVERGSGALIAEGTANSPVIFTSIADDRYGGSGSFNSNSSTTITPAPGDWGGLFFGQATSGSIDNAIISFAGGSTAIEGGAANFNTIEVHQADLRLTKSLLQSNAASSSGNRNGRGANAATTIYVRGSQPIIVDNVFEDNAGSAININANSLRFENMVDLGRSTGEALPYDRLVDNYGPLVRLNRLDNNGTNGMVVRGELLTTESIWDDTDIVHVLQSTVTVDNLHTHGGLTLQSSNQESLVVKLAGGGAGFTATGSPAEIIDRVGGTIHVLGTPLHPVVLTHIADDTVGAGFTSRGEVITNTNNSAGASSGTSGGWRGLLFDEFSNDRNVAVVNENEAPLTNGMDVNVTPTLSQFLGTLAPDEKSGDENRRLGFQVTGFISEDDPTDVDVYSFTGTAGTPIWIDIDRTDTSLDTIVEVVNITGTVLARSVRSGDTTAAGTLNAGELTQNPLLGGDHYTQNFRDAGLHMVLPGTAGTTGTFYVRVRSNPGEGASITSLTGKSTGRYEMQIRLDQVQEFPGSTVRFADIRFAQTAIDVRGLPAHSPLVGEAGELPLGNDTFATSQGLINLLESDMAAINISGSLSNDVDADWYSFDLEQTGVQVIAGVNDGSGTIAVVFDLDYSDNAVRGDTTIAVYDENENLIYVGRDSNVADDQPADSSGNIDDLSRGSLGTNDPYIGPIHLTPGFTYHVAVMSNRQVPTALSGAFLATPANPQTGLVRLEPVNSLSRVVEDHIGTQGYLSRGAPILPSTPAGLFDISSGVVASGVGVDAHVTPFNLGDVQLYVGTDPAGAGTDRLYTANPFEGGFYTTRVASPLVGNNDDIQDIVIRSDGRMFGYQNLGGNTGSVGALVELNPATGAILSTQNDNIRDRGTTPNVSLINTNLGSATARAEQFTTSDAVDALTFERLGDTGGASPTPQYDTYYSVRETTTSSKLYRARQNGDASEAVANANNQRYGVLGDIQPAGVTHASIDLRVSDNGGPPAAVTTIRIESKLPGDAGNLIQLNITRPNNANAGVGVNLATDTINLQIGGTGGPPLTGAPTAQQIVDAINADASARQLVTAVIVSGNAAGGNGNNGTVALNLGLGNGLHSLTGGSDDIANPPLEGRVTGLSFGNFNSTGNLFGVTNAGEFLEINKNSGDVIRRLDVSAAVGAVSFHGLALGPQNVEAGDYQNTLFAIADDGRLFAFDSTLIGGLSANPTTAEVLSVMRAIFDSNGDGTADSISTQVTGTERPIGLAFSPLDFNLWHPTLKRGNDAGHGVNDASDDSRDSASEALTIASPGDVDRTTSQNAGGASFHFGFERWLENPDTNSLSYLTYDPNVNAQFGITNSSVHSDLSSNATIVNTYDFPGGAHGSLTTNPFSLTGSTLDDRPTLYFNYFLETENDDGSSVASDDADPFRDSARVFASRNGGITWELVATNNSQLSPADTTDPNVGELAGFLSHVSDAGLNSAAPRGPNHQIVQELFDNTGQWRQARVDLSTFANEPDVMLRVDFSTAGAIGDASLGDVDTNFGELSHAQRSIRSLQNQFEGFYIDDIIVGYAERGEMVTGTAADSGITDLDGNARTRNSDPEALPNILSGRYQLEVRRTGEYLSSPSGEPPTVAAIFDTNDRHIIDAVETAFISFEPATTIPDLTPVDTTLLGVTAPAATIAPWTVSASDPLTGIRNLESGNVSALQPVSILQANLADLGSVDDSAGIIEFSYKVSSAFETHGLRFFVDGVPQVLVFHSAETHGGDDTLATGETGYATVRFPFGSGDPVFTWVYDFTDGAPPEGQNKAFIDNIRVLQGGTGLLADSNRERPQGTFIIDSNFITQSGGLGINVQPGTEQAGGGVPHPGSNINFPQLNNGNLVPGIVIQNNVIAGSDGIRFAGETNASPNRPVPFGRIVNNTLVGGNRTGVGIDVVGRASPTLLNNLLTDYATAITNGGTGTVIRSNFFQDNTSNGATGTAAILAGASEPLFADAANGNYYLLDGSQALDSSQNIEQDRANFLTFKTELGIPASPIVAPERDVFGQLRVDSNGSAGGGGSTIFKDRGAVDRSDADSPYALLLNPVDNDVAGQDRDPNETIVHLTDQLLENFTIFLGDGRGPNSPIEGTGVDGLTVDDPFDALVSQNAVMIEQNGQALVEGIDYTLGYNPLTGILLLTPLSTLWDPASVYTITLNNTAIADRAGNRLRPNQQNGDTRFTIIMPQVEIDFGDALNSFNTVLNSNGARHALVNDATPRLGTYIDGETDSQGFGTDDFNTIVGVDGNVLTPGDGPFSFTTIPGKVLVNLDSLPVQGDNIEVITGNRRAVFELTENGAPVSLGRVPVSYPTGATTAEIVEILAAVMEAEFPNFDIQATAIYEVVGDTTLTLRGEDDEDGIGIGTVSAAGNLIPNVFLEPATGELLSFLNPLSDEGSEFVVMTQGGGFLNAWIDFNDDGDFADAGEQVFTNQIVSDGENRLEIVTPSTAVTTNGTAYPAARFRLTTDPGTTSSGFAVDGEVEDYQVLVAEVPLATPVTDMFTLVEDPATAFAGDVSLNDSIVGNGVSFVLQADVANGTLVLDSGTGEFTYLPDEDFFGDDTFTYNIDATQTVDGITFPVTSDETVTVTLSVTPVNDPPVAMDQSFTTTEPSNTNTASALTITSADMVAGALEQDDVALRSVPFDEAEQDFFVVQIAARDSSGAYTNIVPLSDASDLASVVDGTYTADSHIASPGGSFVLAGTVEVTVTGGEITQLVYQPSADYNEFNPAADLAATTPSVDELRYTIADDGKTTLPNLSPAVPQPAPEFDEATLTITVRAQNDAPNPFDDFIDSAALGIPLQEGAVVTVDISTFLLGNDLPGNSSGDDEDINTNGHDAGISLATATLPMTTTAGATVSVDGLGNLVLDYSSIPTFSGTDSFDYHILDSGINVATDGTVTSDPKQSLLPATVTIDVAPTNNNVFTLTEDPGTPFAADVTNPLFTGAGLTYTLGTNVSDGTLNLDSSTGLFTYLPDEDFFGTDTFTYTVTGAGTSVLATVTLNVTPVNDAPLAANQSFSTTEPSDTNLSPTLSILGSDLLVGALPQDDAMLRMEPWHELEQDLTVVQIAARDSVGVYQNIVPLSDAADRTSVIDGVYSTSSHVLDPDTGIYVLSATIDITVAGGEVTEVTYSPATDYNEFNPAADVAGATAAVDELIYTIADDGATTLPNGNLAVPQPLPEFDSATISVSVKAQNDTPIALDDFIDSTSLPGLQEEAIVTIDVAALLLANDLEGNLPGDDEDRNLNGHDPGVQFVFGPDPSQLQRFNVFPINSGVLVDDLATGNGFIMFSEQNVATRFPGAEPTSPNPFERNSRHFLAVRQDGAGNWEYNDNTAWVLFTPEPNDRLIALADFDADTISSLQGQVGSIGGIDFGFFDGNLTFEANVLNGIGDAGEFTVDGSFFEVVTDPEFPTAFTPFPLTTTAGATLSVDGSGNLTLDYSGLKDYYGPDSFVYWVIDQGVDIDANGVVTQNPKYSLAPATVSLIVDPVNDLPSVTDKLRTILEDETIHITAAELLLESFGNEDPVTDPAAPGFGFPFNESNQDDPNTVITELIADGVTINGSNFNSQSTFRTNDGQLENIQFDANGFLVDFVYRPDQDYNADIPVSAGPRSVDSVLFTVQDNGISVLPQGGVSSPAPEEVTATLSISVRPQNDPPVLVSDLITATDPIWNIYSSVDPTEDTTLIIPSAFLFDNDRNSRSTALDERAGINDDTQLTLVPINFTTSLGGTVRLLNNGDLSYTPPADVYGLDTFEYAALDSGIDEDVLGVQLSNPLNINDRATVSILIAPVNDRPATSDRSFQTTEDVTDDVAGEFAFTASDLLTSPDAVATNVTPLPPAPFDENEQTLRVVAFGDSSGNIIADVSSLPGETGTTTMLTGNGSVELTFDSGAFVSGVYTPGEDYNQRTPFDLEDLFTYVVSDDGRTTIPGSGLLTGGADTVEFLPDERSEPATITFSVASVNDKPVFDYEPLVQISERDDNGETTFEWATNILPGPATALDELIRETVAFSYVPGASTVPAGLFRLDPAVTPDGTLSVFPNPDAFGDATLVFEFTDVDAITPGFTPETDQVTFALRVLPVNDRPRINTALAGSSDIASSDRAYAVANDGEITYTLKEDNTSFDGVSAGPYIIPLRAALGNTGYVAPGLLDLFTPGPQNEIDPLLGGSQELVLSTFSTQTALGGSLTLTPDGTAFEYVPPTNFNNLIGGPDSFTYAVSDFSTVAPFGETYSIAASGLIDDELTSNNRVFLNLTPVNDRPEFTVSTNFIEILETDPGTPIQQLNGFAPNVAAGPTDPAGPADDENSRIDGQDFSFRVVPTNLTPAELANFFIAPPTINPGGVLEYQPIPDAFGDFEFEIYLEDTGAHNPARGDLNVSLPETLTINVRPTNDAPVIDPAAVGTLDFSVSENATIDIPADGSSVAGDLLGAFTVGPINEASAVTPGGNQTLTLQNVPATTDQGGSLAPVMDSSGSVTHYRYMRNDNFVGTDTFVYQVVDNGQSVALGTNGLVQSDPIATDVTVTINVLPVNDAPIFTLLNAGNVTVQEEDGLVPIAGWASGILPGPSDATDELSGPTAQTVSIDIAYVSGDTGILTSDPTAVISGNSATLNVETTGISNGSAVYVATFTDSGPSDAGNGDVNSASQTFTVTVVAQNDPPMFTAGGPVSVEEDSGAYSDEDPWATNITPGIGETTTQTISSFAVVVPLGSEGLFAVPPNIDTNGFLTFTPADNAVGSVDVEVTAFDSLGGMSSTAILPITITNVTDPPVPQDDFIDTDEDIVLTIDVADLLANDLDPDLQTDPNEMLTISIPATQTSALGATVTYRPATGEILYDPSTSTTLQELAPGETVEDRFTYSVNDADGETSPPSADVVLTIEGVNDAPQLTPDDLLVSNDVGVVLDVTSNDIDVDGVINPASIIITVQPVNGALTIADDGTLTYRSEVGYVGTDSFQYTVADELGQQSEETLVSLGVGIAPSTGNDVAGTFLGNAINVDVLANDSPNADPASVIIETAPTNGTAVPQTDGTILYTPNDGYTGPDSFAYSVADANGRRGVATAVSVNTVESSLQNPLSFYDVNASGEVTSLDALLIMNRLSESGGASSIPVLDTDRGPNFFNVSGDGFVSALDALLVMNQLNSQEASAQGEFVSDILPASSNEQSSTQAPIADETMDVNESADKVISCNAFVQEVNPALIDAIVNEHDEDESIEEAFDEALKGLI